MRAEQELPSRLGTRAGAVPLALGGMLGAGLFTGLAPAAAEAGWWLFAGIPLAALMAGCAATVSAQRAATASTWRAGTVCPGGFACELGGASYDGVRSNLGVAAGRVCVSTDVVGSIAAMAALARSIENYLAPEVPSGFAAIVVLVAVLAATAGLRIRGGAAWLWLGLVLLVVGVIVAACFAIDPPSSVFGASGAGPGWAGPGGSPGGDDSPVGDRGAAGLTGAGGVLFFAFLGFERLTAPVLGKDHRDWRAVRVGVTVSCVVVTGLLLLMAFALAYQLGPARLALSPAPVRDALGAAAAGDLGPLLGVAVAVAMVPALLAVLETSRSTPLAAVRDGELPATLGRIGAAGTPFVLDVVLGVLAAGLGFFVAPAHVMALASACLLVHYAFASVAGGVRAERSPLWVRRVSCVGMALGVVLVVSLPLATLFETAVVVLAGPVLGAFASRRRR